MRPDAAGADPAEVAERRAALARLRRFGGARLVRDMAALFLAETPERVDAARRALAAGDRDALARAAHALRSSLGQFGATAAASACAELEAAAAGAPASELEAGVDRLARLCAECRAWFEGEIAAPDAPAVPT
jgi:HPt (histidine-containing phosphotransfer) domain-containing protein